MMLLFIASLLINLMVVGSFQFPMVRQISRSKVSPFGKQLLMIGSHKNSELNLFDDSEDLWERKSAVSTEKPSTSDSALVPSKESTWGPRVLLLVVAALYGTNFGCVKILGETLDPSVAAFLRFTISSLVFAPSALPFIFSKPQVILAGAEVGVYCTIAYIAQAIALQTTAASTAAFICSLAVVVVPVLDLLFGKKKDDSPWYTAILPSLLAAVGVGCLELGGNDIPGIGDLLCFLQPIFFGLYFWRAEKHTRNFPLPEETRAFTGASMITVALLSAAWAGHDFLLPLLGQGSEYMMNGIHSQMNAFSDWHVTAAILWTGIVTTALTCYGENVAMVKLTAAESTIIYSTEPLWGTLFAVMVLGEQVGWNTGIGAALIISACIWSSIGPTLSAAGIISTFQAATIMPEIFENMAINWERLLQSLESYLDL